MSLKRFCISVSLKNRFHSIYRCDVVIFLLVLFLILYNMVENMSKSVLTKCSQQIITENAKILIENKYCIEAATRGVL